MHVHCDSGWTCKGDNWESGGIKIFHGAGSKFQRKDGSHALLYDTYREVIMMDMIYDVYKLNFLKFS